jgi:O-antigen ligase
MIREHPWTGVGHGAYRAEFSAAKLALIEERFEFYRGHLYPVFVNAHNDLLEAAAEWGVAGVLALTWGLWILAAHVRRKGSRADTHGSEDRALAMAGLAALAIQSLGYFPFRTALLAYPALLFLSWALSDAPEATR